MPPRWQRGARGRPRPSRGDRWSVGGIAWGATHNVARKHARGFWPAVPGPFDDEKELVRELGEQTDLQDTRVLERDTPAGMAVGPAERPRDGTAPKLELGECRRVLEILVTACNRAG